MVNSSSLVTGSTNARKPLSALTKRITCSITRRNTWSNSSVEFSTRAISYRVSNSLRSRLSVLILEFRAWRSRSNGVRTLLETGCAVLAICPCNSCNTRWSVWLSRPNSRSASRLNCSESLSKRTRGSLLSLAYVPSTALSNFWVCSCKLREIRINASPIERKSLKAFDAISGDTLKCLPPSYKHSGTNETPLQQTDSEILWLHSHSAKRPNSTKGKGMISIY